jgi:cellulose biosynthesis protein BcsQ
MAFLYSDYYIIPSVMNALSTRGVKHYINIINEIYNSYCKYNENAALFSMLFGHEPKLIGIFETMLKGTTDSDKHRNSFEKKYLFETVIKHRKDIAENTSDGHSVDKHEDYKKLTEEMLERIKQLDTDV